MNVTWTKISDDVLTEEEGPWSYDDDGAVFCQNELIFMAIGPKAARCAVLSLNSLEARADRAEAALADAADPDDAEREEAN